MALGEKLFSATHANLGSLPEQSGVFTLYEEGQMIFIGRADGSGHTLRSKSSWITRKRRNGALDICSIFDHYFARSDDECRAALPRAPAAPCSAIIGSPSATTGVAGWCSIVAKASIADNSMNQRRASGAATISAGAA